MILFLRTAKFPEPGFDLLLVASVLETHNRLFSQYHLYSTMCYWFAGSTYESIVEIANGIDTLDPEHATLRGVAALVNGTIDVIGYKGVTRKSLESSQVVRSENLDTFEGNKYERLLQAIEKNATKGRVVEPALPGASVTPRGWDITKLVQLFQECPSQEVLVAESIKRAGDVRNQLQEVCITDLCIEFYWC